MKIQKTRIWDLVERLIPITLLVVLFLLLKPNWEKNGEHETKPIIVTDTIFVDRVLEIEKPFERLENPRTIYFYKVDTVEVTKVVKVHDTVKLFLKDSSEVNYSSKFLVNYTEAPKVLQINLKKKRFDLSLMYPNGTVQLQKFDVDVTNNDYHWDYQSNLTSKKINFFRKLKPVIEVQFKPIHLMTDVNLGVRYHSRWIYYELGINGFYYPALKNVPSGDVYLKFGVNF